MKKNNRYLVFKIEDKILAFNMFDILELVRYNKEAISEVPLAPKFVEGVMNIQGEIIPVIDLRVRFNLERMESKYKVIVILKVKDKKIGVVVDDILDVYTIDDFYDYKSTGSNDCVDKIGKMNDSMVFILNLEKITSFEDIYFNIESFEKGEV